MVENAAYNAAGQMTSLLWATSPNLTETFAYNNLSQLTRETMPGSQMDMQYIYTAGQNNGRLAQSIDNISGQTVNYTYDALNRLTAAAATGGQWGQAYAYDGFGNLKSKTVTAGSGSSWSNASSPSTNRLIGQSYDANGNALFMSTTYDVENRMTARALSSTSAPNPRQEYYQYDPSGKRVSRLMSGSAAYDNVMEIYSYDIAGHRTVTTTCYYRSDPSPTCQVPTPVTGSPGDELYFGGQLIRAYGAWTLTDRLGSVRADLNGSRLEQIQYLPYGEEQNNPTTPDGRTKFATYTRDDTLNNQDYANQRYYNPWMGRFNSPDPIGARSVDPNDPTSWNMYGYVGGDPVNRNDSTGTDGLCDLDWYLDGFMPIGCGDSSWNGPFAPIPGCGGIPADEFNPGVAMACLDMLDLSPPEDMWTTFELDTETGGTGVAKKVLKNLPKALKRLMKFKTKADGPCETDLSAIGLSQASVQSIAGNVSVVNAASSDQSVYGDLEVQHADFGVIVGTNTIYYDQNYFWQGTMKLLMATLIHEFSHVNGMGDRQDQANLGVAVGAATVNITMKLATDCFGYRGQ